MFWPCSLASKSQLGRANLPREPGGPVRGWVAGRDFRGREMDVELYAVAESVPTKATAGLAAADRRRTATVRVCTDRGANCQQPLAERRGRYLCAMCAKLARVMDFQIELRRRAELAEWLTAGWPRRTRRAPAGPRPGCIPPDARMQLRPSALLPRQAATVAVSAAARPEARIRDSLPGRPAQQRPSQKHPAPVK
ncbi:hypothetical protein GCM10010246_13160 [Streptomyces cuspidosporus]|uniref:Transposase n=2 Tax=Streptomyces cuspidosporus TaxID=66882 RepID=A0ABP5SHI8_9ACTN